MLDVKDRKGKSNQQAINKTLESRKRNSSKDVDGQPQNRKRERMEVEHTSSPQLNLKKRSWPTSQEMGDTTEKRSIIRKKVTLDLDDSSDDSVDSNSFESDSWKLTRISSRSCSSLKRSSSKEKPLVTFSRQDKRVKRLENRRKVTLDLDDSSDDDSSERSIQV